MKQVDIRELRPLYVPGALLAGALLLWAIAIPTIEGYYEQTAGVVKQLQVELQGLRAETGRKQSEAEQLSRSIDEYNRLIGQGLAAPQDRLAAGATIERLAHLHHLGTPRYTISPERQVEGAAFKAGEIGVVSAEITIAVDGLLDTHIAAYLDALREALPGRTQLLAVTLEKSAVVPAGPALAAGGMDQVFTRGTASLLWRTIRLPSPPTKAAAK